MAIKNALRHCYILINTDPAREHMEHIFYQHKLGVDDDFYGDVIARLEKQLDEKSSQLVAHDDFIQQSIQEARQFGRYIKADDLIAYFETFIKEYNQKYQTDISSKFIHVIETLKEPHHIKYALRYFKETVKRDKFRKSRNL